MLSQYIPFHHNDPIFKYQCSFYYLVYAYRILQKGTTVSYYQHHHICTPPADCVQCFSIWHDFWRSFVVGSKVLLVFSGFYWYFYTIWRLPLCSVAILVFSTLYVDKLYHNRQFCSSSISRKLKIISNFKNIYKNLSNGSYFQFIYDKLMPTLVIINMINEIVRIFYLSDFISMVFFHTAQYYHHNISSCAQKKNNNFKFTIRSLKYWINLFVYVST